MDTTQELAAILRDARKSALLRMRSEIFSRALRERPREATRPAREAPHQCATTSTSPSTPLTTLKGRSYTLPSFLAMARYSPSDRMTRGNAPIDSLMTSPPGVITDQAVLASASPPLSLTSLSVM